MDGVMQADLRRSLMAAVGGDRRAVQVLLVEDNPGDARLIELALADGASRPFRVTIVDTLAAALERKDGHDAILLDLHLPDSSGLAGLRELALAAHRTPIVVLTGLDCDELAVEACRHGAQEYLVKGKADLALLARSIRCAMERKAFEAVLADRAYCDALTGLVNRPLFVDRLAHCVMQARRSGRRAALMFVDLDNFKAVNDGRGHLAGDQILRAVANALRTAVRTSDTVARIGGDEFTVLLDPIEDSGDVARVADKVMRALKAAGRVLGLPVAVTASVGVAVLPCDAEDAEGLLLRADQAMYAAKRAGGNAIRFAAGLTPAAGRAALEAATTI